MFRLKSQCSVFVLALAIVSSLHPANATAQADRRSLAQEDVARRELAAKNYNFNEEVFLERVRERDAAVIKLFLASGMSPI